MRSLLPLAFLSFLPFAQAAPPDPYWPQMSDNIALRSIGQQLQNGVGISGTVQTAVSGVQTSVITGPVVAQQSGVWTNAPVVAVGVTVSTDASPASTNTLDSLACSEVVVFNFSSTLTNYVWRSGLGPFIVPLFTGCGSSG